DAVGPEVAFDDRVMRFAAVQVLVKHAAVKPHFLGPEPDHANGPQGPAGVHDVLRRGGGDGDAGAVVDCTGAEVPAVEMPADEEHGGLRVAPGDFRNDVARFALPDAGDERQVHAHRLAALEDALELLGVGNGKGGGRDGRGT